jgi:hypothetical protein
MLDTRRVVKRRRSAHPGGRLADELLEPQDGRKKPAAGRAASSAPGLALGFLVLLGLFGCDFDVVNPGDTEDQFLNDEEAHAALVVGVKRVFGTGMTDAAWLSATVARENFGPRELSNVRLGNVLPEDVNNEWTDLHSARWTAEDAIRRITQVLGEAAAASDENVLKAHVYAGFANRMLGDLFCDAVIDEGDVQPHTVHWTRAEQHFTDAIAMGAESDTLSSAAFAGRAGTRLMMGAYSDAADDAGQVSRDFQFQQFFSDEDANTVNRFVNFNDLSPYRRSTVFSTYFDDYFAETGDPRTPWGSDPAFPNTEVADLPWHFELKYGRGLGNLGLPMTITSGLEMQLIIAENHLRNGSRDQALAIMNERRAGLGLPDIVAASDAEAWTALKLERFREMWLEARAQPDHRRYAEDNTPGPLPDLLDQAGGGRDLCWPIAEVESASNPNVP